MLSRLGHLSEDQKTSLDSFITRSRTYVRVDDVFYKTLFKAMKQKEDQSFRTFFLNLTKVYKKAYNRVEPWSENDLKSIKRQFLKGLADSRIRDKLMGLSETSLTIGGANDLVTQSEYFKAALRDIIGTNSNDHVNVMSAINSAVNELTLFTKNAKEDKLKSDEQNKAKDYRCFSCGGKGHFAQDCRASDKFRRTNMRNYNNKAGQTSSNQQRYNREDHKNTGYRPLREFPDRQGREQGTQNYPQWGRGTNNHRGNYYNKPVTNRGYHSQNHHQGNYRNQHHTNRGYHNQNNQRPHRSYYQSNEGHNNYGSLETHAYTDDQTRNNYGVYGSGN